jgi:predicted glycosyltransferase
MNILIDINHPAHVHYFRNLISLLENQGHDVLVTARSRKVILHLLSKYGIKYIERGQGSDSLSGKLFYLLKANLKLLRISLKFKPDLFLNFSTPYAAHVSFLLRKPNVVLNDTEHVDKINSLLTYPFCSVVFTPFCYLNDLGRKQIRFKNVMEGFYLNPSVFEMDKNVRKELGIRKDEKYIIFRFVSWKAHHDRGHSGLDVESKNDIIEYLRHDYRVFISSEAELPQEYECYRLSVSPDKIHHILAFAELFIAESATMVSECAILGTPAIYVNSLPEMGYLKMEEANGLIKQFRSSEGVLDYIKSLHELEDVKTDCKIKSLKMQEDFIEPNEYLMSYLNRNYLEGVSAGDSIAKT